MKKAIRLILATFVIILNFSSCEKQEEITNEDLSFLTKEERIENLNLLSQNFENYYNHLQNEQKITTNLKNNQKQLLLNDIISQSKSILNNLGLSEKDLDEFSTEEYEMFYITFGAGMVAKHNSSPYSSFNKSNTTKGDAWSCLKSAIGIDALATLVEAGYEIYAGETAAGWAVDSAAAASFRKAGIQAAKKVISRWAGFFGAAVVIGEFLWCMSN